MSDKNVASEPRRAVHSQGRSGSVLVSLGDYIRSRRLRRRYAYVLGAILAIGVLTAFSLLPEGRALAKGPANPGHEDLVCADCHRKAPGTLRQQLQGVVAFGLGRRSQLPTVGRFEVGNDVCIDCHDRSSDRHPVYRFFEPRFSLAREEIGAQQCKSCHTEHSGRHVSNRGEFCSSCHADLRLRRDTVQPSHEQLAFAEQWDTCLRCHDFHGNHDWDPPDRLENALSASNVQSYLEDAGSPYGPRVEKASRK